MRTSGSVVAAAAGRMAARLRLAMIAMEAVERMVNMTALLVDPRMRPSRPPNDEEMHQRTRRRCSRGNRRRRYIKASTQRAAIARQAHTARRRCIEVIAV